MTGAVHTKRIQLTLFASESESAELETLRRKFNPEQYALIQCHITLCREDELLPLDAVIRNLESLNLGQFRMELCRPLRFAEGKGVLIPAMDTDEIFQNLRKKILNGIIASPRIQEPHITLIHPRNGTCTDEIFEEIEKCEIPKSLLFKKISLIEQEAGMKWKILQEFE